MAELGDTAVFASGGGRLARIDAGTGTTEWITDTSADAFLRVHPPDLVSAHRMFAGSGADDAGGGTLLFHDAATGRVLHRIPAVGLVGLVVVDRIAVVHLPAEHAVRGIDLDTGRVRWQVPLDEEGALATTVTDDPPTVVVHEPLARRVRRLDPATGDVLWEVELSFAPTRPGGSAFLGQPLIAGDRVVVEDRSSLVTVLDLATGERTPGGRRRPGPRRPVGGAAGRGPAGTRLGTGRPPGGRRPQ